jgi:hypothetical protein
MIVIFLTNDFILDICILEPVNNLICVIHCLENPERRV